VAGATPLRAARRGLEIAQTGESPPPSLVRGQNLRRRDAEFTVMLPISATWSILPKLPTAKLLTRSIDAFVQKQSPEAAA
jgi:hypothetical protein